MFLNITNLGLIKSIEEEVVSFTTSVENEGKKLVKIWTLSIEYVEVIF